MPEGAHRRTRSSIAIICDDSRTQRLNRLSASRFRSRLEFGRVDYSAEIGELLRKHRMGFPTDDLELESKYKSVLSDYARPMGELLGGTFRSVSSLEKELGQFASVDTYILSRRYGLVESDFVGIPYVCRHELYSSAAQNDFNKQFVESFARLAPQYNVLVVLLSTSSLRSLLGRKTPTPLRNLRPDQQLFIVAAESSANKLRGWSSPHGQSSGPIVHIYPRVGVTPVTKSARQDITHHIKGASRSWQ